MMGRAVVYDLCKHSNFGSIAIADRDKKTLQSAENFLNKREIDFLMLDVEKTNEVKKIHILVKDNRHASWRKLPIFRWHFYVGKKESPSMAFPNSYRMEYRFDGYKNLPADMVTLGKSH